MGEKTEVVVEQADPGKLVLGRERTVLDWRWMVLLLSQIGTGLILLFLVPGDDTRGLAMGLLFSAFGQGATGGLKATTTTVTK